MADLMKEILEIDLPLIGGGIGGGVIKNLSKKLTSNEKFQSASPLVVGIFLRRMKNPMVRYAGMGMIAVGGRDLTGTFIPAVRGIEDMDLGDLFDNVLNGSYSVSDDVLNDDLNGGVLNDSLNDTLSGEDYM